MYLIKKLLCLCLICFMSIFIMLVGCSKTIDMNETSANNESESVISKKVPYEVNYYYISGGVQPNNGKVEAAASKYLQEELGIDATLKLNCYDWGTYDQKIRMMLAASEYLDLCWSTNWAVDSFSRCRDGSFLELSNLLDKIPKLKAELGQLLDLAKVDGKYFLIPQKKESTFSHAIIYNKTLADKYGIDMTGVTSLESLEPKLKEFHEKDSETQAWHGGMGIPFTKMFDKVDFFTYIENGEFKSYYHNEKVKSAYMLMNKWAKLGYIAKDAATKDAGPSLEAGEFFAYAEGEGTKPGYAAEKNAIFKFEVEQIDISKPFTGTWSIFGTVTSVARSSRNPEKALQVLEALMTDKYLTNLINFGIENENYKKIDENTIELIPDSGYMPGVPWEIGNRSLCYLISTEPRNLYQMYKDASKEAEISEMIGFVPDYSPVSAEYAALSNIQKEYGRAFSAGLMDEAYYGKFLEKVEIAGIDKLLEEEQHQFEVWKAIQ